MKVDITKQDIYKISDSNFSIQISKYEQQWQGIPVHTVNIECLDKTKKLPKLKKSFHPLSNGGVLKNFFDPLIFIINNHQKFNVLDVEDGN